MEYRTLGRTGVRVSALALGTANFADPTPENEAKRILERAVDAGINLIDTGDSYGKGEACEDARLRAAPGDRVVVFGSFYLVGPALSALGLYSAPSQSGDVSAKWTGV